MTLTSFQYPTMIISSLSRFQCPSNPHRSFNIPCSNIVHDTWLLGFAIGIMFWETCLIRTLRTYLLIRGIKTLHLRVQQQNSTALRMAQVFEAHPKVSRVYYLGLPSHPENHIAKRQMSGFGSMISRLATIKFVDYLKIPYIASSFGRCESIVDQPAIMSYWDLTQEERLKYGIKDNSVRFCFGADIIQALETI